MLIDWMQYSQETLDSTENIHLYISKSPTANEWRLLPYETENNNNTRFPNPCNTQAKSFELRRKKDFPKLVKRCQGKCARVTFIKDVLVVKSYGAVESRKINGTEISLFGPMYIHFREKSLMGWNKDIYNRPGIWFDYSIIKVDKNCIAQLPNAEKNFLKNLGVKI